VPAAVLMDLGVGDFSIRPDAEAGYQACLKATREPSSEGNVGAGAGASVGKFFGPAFAMKGGLGTASWTLPGTDIVVGAVVAVNAVGDVYDPRSSSILAGARAEGGSGFRDTVAALMGGHGLTSPAGANTTIGVIATNAPFNKAQLRKIAQLAHDGFARAINPVHTMYDGDTIFALSTGKSTHHAADVTVIGTVAAQVMAHAIARAVMQAESLPQYDLPAWRDYAGSAPG
jgi:L-aminopeptidase/D-esterase-like protein